MRLLASEQENIQNNNQLDWTVALYVVFTCLHINLKQKNKTTKKSSTCFSRSIRRTVMIANTPHTQIVHSFMYNHQMRIMQMKYGERRKRKYTQAFIERKLKSRVEINPRESPNRNERHNTDPYFIRHEGVSEKNARNINIRGSSNSRSKISSHRLDRKKWETYQ